MTDQLTLFGDETKKPVSRKLTNFANPKTENK